jgi:hypothetical protein
MKFTFPGNWCPVTGSMSQSFIDEIKPRSRVADILGYKCDELVLTCKSGIQKFYYNPAIKVDGALFKDHKFGNWSEVLSRINAMPLKISMDSPQFSLESVALDVKKKKLTMRSSRSLLEPLFKRVRISLLLSERNMCPGLKDNGQPNACLCHDLTSALIPLKLVCYISYWNIQKMHFLTRRIFKCISASFRE